MEQVSGGLAGVGSWGGLPNLTVAPTQLLGMRRRNNDETRTVLEGGRASRTEAGREQASMSMRTAMVDEHRRQARAVGSGAAAEWWAFGSPAARLGGGHARDEQGRLRCWRGGRGWWRAWSTGSSETAGCGIRRPGWRAQSSAAARPLLLLTRAGLSPAQHQPMASGSDCPRPAVDSHQPSSAQCRAAPRRGIAVSHRPPRLPCSRKRAQSPPPRNLAWMACHAGAPGPPQPPPPPSPRACES